MSGSFIVCLSCFSKYDERKHKTCPECGVQPNTDRSAATKQRASAVILSTTDHIEGREISEFLGLVFGAGNASWTIETTAGRAGTALGKAEDQLRSAAAGLRADAVIGIAFSMDSSGSALNRSQAITLLGTAVKLKKSTGGV